MGRQEFPNASGTAGAQSSDEDATKTTGKKTTGKKTTGKKTTGKKTTGKKTTGKKTTGKKTTPKAEGEEATPPASSGRAEAYAATVETAKWLLGTAGALTPVIVAGVGFTRLGDAVGRPWATALAVIAVMVAGAAIVSVLWAGSRVLLVPYADLSVVLTLRHTYLTPEETWRKDWAEKQWEEGSRVVAAQTGGQIAGLSELHKTLQDLKASSKSSDAARRAELEDVAQVVVAAVNHLEVGRRFRVLRGVYMAAVVMVLVAVTIFVLATTAPPGEVKLTEPVAVRVLPVGGEWTGTLAGCPAAELAGAAVSGAWPRPEVLVVPAEKCPATRVSEGVIAVPLADDSIRQELPPGPQTAPLAGPTPVLVYPLQPDEGWPEPLQDCAAEVLEGSAVVGTWPSPTVAVSPRSPDCPAALLSSGVVVIPATSPAEEPGEEPQE